MKKKSKAYYVIVILVTIIIVALFLEFFLTLNIQKRNQDNELFNASADAKYHFFVIIDSSYQTYDDAFFEGLKVASEKNNIALEVVEVKGANYIDQVIDLLDMAKFAKMDGIILHAINNDLLNNKIKELVTTGLPVVLINEDLPESNRISYIGINRYIIGQSAGETLGKAMNGKGKIAVMSQQYNKQTGDLMILGLTKALEGFSAMSLELVEYTETGALNAETIASQIFKDHPEINGIFCSSGENALGTIQAIVDGNLVNQITLISYGGQEELLNYVKTGNIVKATIISDHFEISQLAVTTLFEFKNNELVSSYINTYIKTLTQFNIESYLNEEKDETIKNQ